MFNKNVVRIGVSFALAGLSIASFAAERIDLRERNGMMGVMAATSNAQQMLSMSANESLKLRKEIVETDGKVFQRYQQMYQGIPVWGDEVVVVRNLTSLLPLCTAFTHRILCKMWQPPRQR